MTDETQTQQPTQTETPAPEQTAENLFAEEYAKALAEVDPEAATERPEANKPEERRKPADAKKEPEEFRALRKREERLRRQTERQFAEERQKLAEERKRLEAEAAEVAQLRALARAKTMQERAQIAGIDLEKLAEEFAGRTSADDAREAAAAELARFQAAQQEARREAQKKQHEEAQKRQLAEEQTFIREAADHDAIVEMVRAGEWDDADVVREGYRVGHALLEELGRAPTNAEVLDRVAQRASRFLGRTDNVPPPNGQRATPEPQQASGKPGNRAKTLTGQQGLAPVAEDEFDPNDREAVSRLLMKAARSR